MTIYMLLEWLTFFLQVLSFYIANIAEIFFIVSQLIILFSKGTERIQHNTRYDVRKQNSEENSIEHIVSKSDRFKTLHGLAYCSRNKQLHDTIEHTMAHIIDMFLSSIDIFQVIAEGYCTKYKSKDTSHDAHISQFHNVEADGFEYVSYLWIVTENIHDVKEENRWIEECSKESYTSVDSYSVELCIKI